MKPSVQRQRGQALILIVLAIVGMVGLTGLAIDGGNAYSDRRHAQNAADTSALAAALRIIHNQTDWQQAGLIQAQANGYPAAGPDSTVNVYLCNAVPAGQPACVLGPGVTDPQNFVQVVIVSTVHTYFAPIFGIRQLTNQVMAIARAVPSVPQPWFNGNSLVALMMGCKSPAWNHFPFETGGSSVQNIAGSQILVNSTCPDAFYDNGNANTLNSTGICDNGGVSGGSSSGINPPPTTNCGPVQDPSKYQMPPANDSSCDSEGDGQILDLGGGQLYAKPGRYYGTFPPGTSGNLKLGQGIYCLKNGMSVQGGWDLTTDLNDNGYNDPNEGAFFLIENGDVNISGGSTMYLHAISNSNNIGPDLVNYLMYMPAPNNSSISIAGGGTNQYIGTILAPNSLISLSGGSGTDSLNMQTQIIGYSIKLAGGGNLNITYNQTTNATTYTNPSLSPYK